jgi:putative transposase
VSCFRFIATVAADHPVALSCRVLGVSRAGFYAWRERPPSARARADAALTAVIHAIHHESRGVYGSPRIHAELQATGRRHGRKRVARLMRQGGLAGCHRPRRRRPRTTVADPAAAPAPNLVRRHFDPLAPDRLWLADITYVPTGEGWLYLAAVLDAFSRRVVGWAMADHLRTELVLDALTMALATRRPAAGLVHHSDRGCQYTSLAFGRRLAEAGLVPSMSRTANCFDNAVAESFFATLKRELVDRPDRTPWPDRAAARQAIFDYVEIFYNRRRRHSTLRYLSPAAYEAAHRTSAAAAVA